MNEESILNLSTPALLFSAISLIMLAYTNRFLAYAALVRSLYDKYMNNPEEHILLAQIENLQKRLFLTRAMQINGITSLLLCVLTMFLIYVNHVVWAEVVFGIALILLIISLSLLIREIQISGKSLNLQLKNLRKMTSEK
ncbi:MAG: DUF2721 domain-containing protein [Bacteroidales bacterium]